METVRQEWLDRLFDCKLRTNRKTAIRYINWLYKLSGLKKPMIIFLSSPLGIQYGANMLKSDGCGDQVEAQVRDQVEAQVWDQVRDQVEAQVWAQVWAQVGDQVGAQVRDQVWDQVRDQVWDQVGDQVRDQVEAQVWAQVWAQVGDQVGAQVRDQVWDQVRDQVWDQVGAQVWDQVWAQKLEYHYVSSYGNIWDYGWVSFYDFFTRIGVIDFDLFNKFVFFLKSGVYGMLTFEKVCIVSDMPTRITRNEKNQMHNESEFAIEWADGYGQYWYNGVAVTEKIIKTPEKLTKKDWMKESNTEVRRIIQERMGERFIKAIGSKVIDRGTKADLVEVQLKDDPDKVARYIHVQDSSTKRKYYLRVPPTIDKADEAWCWGLGLDVSDISKIIKET